MISLILYFEGIPELQEYLNRHPEASKYLQLPKNAHMRGVRTSAKWEQSEYDFILDNYHKFSIKVLAENLHRTPQAVHKMIKKGALRPKTNRNSPPHTI